MIEIQNSKFSSFLKTFSNQQIYHKIVKIQSSFFSSKFFSIEQIFTELSIFKILFSLLHHQIFTKSSSFKILLSFSPQNLFRSLLSSSINFHKIVKIQDPSSSSIPNFHKNSFNRFSSLLERLLRSIEFPQNSPLFLFLSPFLRSKFPRDSAKIHNAKKREENRESKVQGVPPEQGHRRFPRIENPLFFIFKSLLPDLAARREGKFGLSTPLALTGGWKRLAAGRKRGRNGHDFSENEGSQQEQKDRKGAGTTGRLTHTDF